MPEKGAPILVVGGTSRIAVALAPRLGDRACYVSRRPSGLPRETLVEDYGRLPARVWSGVDRVINCVGTSKGDAALLGMVNVDIACGVAGEAKAAGVRRMIHLSSFSVYGRARAIGRSTPTAPTSVYGRSKLSADRALLALVDDRFAVTILRLPLIYSPGGLGKLGQLLRWWTRLRFLPVPVDDVVRAMISVELSAEIVARLASGPPGDVAGEVVFAADPLPFTYAHAALARANAGAGLLRRLPIPRVVTHLAEHVAPAIGGRLFANSQLAEADNLSVRFGLESSLYGDIAHADLD